MEDEIKEELEKRYKNLKIEVRFIEFRKYFIEIKLMDKILINKYTWDNHLTFDGNINILEYSIDDFIIRCFKRNGEKVKIKDIIKNINK